MTDYGDGPERGNAQTWAFMAAECARLLRERDEARREAKRLRAETETWRLEAHRYRAAEDRAKEEVVWLWRLVENYRKAAMDERMCPNCGKHPAWWLVNNDPSNCPICEDWREMPDAEKAAFGWPADA